MQDAIRKIPIKQEGLLYSDSKLKELKYSCLSDKMPKDSIVAHRAKYRLLYYKFILARSSLSKLVNDTNIGIYNEYCDDLVKHIDYKDTINRELVGRKVLVMNRPTVNADIRDNKLIVWYEPIAKNLTKNLDIK